MLHAVWNLNWQYVSNSSSYEFHLVPQLVQWKSYQLASFGVGIINSKSKVRTSLSLLGGRKYFFMISSAFGPETVTWWVTWFGIFLMLQLLWKNMKSNFSHQSQIAWNSRILSQDHLSLTHGHYNKRVKFDNFTSQSVSRKYHNGIGAEYDYIHLEKGTNYVAIYMRREYVYLRVTESSWCVIPSESHHLTINYIVLLCLLFLI